MLKKPVWALFPRTLLYVTDVHICNCRKSVYVHTCRKRDVVVYNYM